MQLIIIIYTKSTNISFNNYFLLTNIIWLCGNQNHWLFPINDDFQSHVRQRQLFSLGTQHLIFLLFEDKGRLHAHHNRIKIDHCRDNLYQASLSEIATDRDRTRLPPIEIERDFAITDLAYLIAGLVTITQFRLVHRMLQGVEHTDPTECSSSHLLH